MIIVYVAFFVLSLIGLISLVRLAFISFYRVRDNFCSNYLVLCINEKQSGDIALETTLALSRLKWMNTREFDGVIVADCGLSEENRKACSEICKLFGFELKKIIDKKNII